MKTQAYIINSNNEVIATVNTELANRTEVRYAYNATKNALNADREIDLVDARYGKISRAKKYAKACEFRYVDYANEVNEKEFLIIS